MADNAVALSDTEKSISMTVGGKLRINDAAVNDVLSAMERLTKECPLAGIGFQNATLTITAQDLRALIINLRPGEPPQFNFSGDSFWTEDEFNLLHVLGERVMSLVAVYGMTNLNIAYA